MVERRRFLKMLGACAAVAPGLLACSDAATSLPTVSPEGGPDADGGSSPTSPTEPGNVKDLPVGTVRGLSNAPIILGRDAQGVYAMSSLCTHRSCDLRTRGTIGAKGIACDCHGSEFTGNGIVTAGPATRALPHYAVTLAADGTIAIDVATVVAADVRAAVS